MAGRATSRCTRERSINNPAVNECNSYSSSNNSEWKSTTIQRKKLLNSTNAAVQQQCKNKTNGPTSPTEASIAPIYYSGTISNSKEGMYDCIRKK